MNKLQYSIIYDLECQVIFTAMLCRSLSPRQGASAPGVSINCCV